VPDSCHCALLPNLDAGRRRSGLTVLPEVDDRPVADPALQRGLAEDRGVDREPAATRRGAGLVLGLCHRAAGALRSLERGRFALRLKIARRAAALWGRLLLLLGGRRLLLHLRHLELLLADRKLELLQREVLLVAERVLDRVGEVSDLILARISSTVLFARLLDRRLGVEEVRR
jgi:hypothetical protein